MQTVLTLNKSVTFLTSGTWTAPITGPALLEGCGGGGAGSGGGGGGGGGALLLHAIVNVISGVSYDIVVGTGGVAPASTTAQGGDGGSTTFISASTTLASFIGAAGGDGAGGSGHDGAAGANSSVIGLVTVAGPGYGGTGAGQIYSAQSGSAQYFNVYQGGAPGTFSNPFNAGGGGGAGPYGDGGIGGTGLGGDTAGAANSGAGGGGGSGEEYGADGGSGRLTITWNQLTIDT